ncbi:hypothetical protein BCR36DRAFT_578954 [Piromyces finnis]|uniref:Uncharacterized protein n=1 Tax=Piromyces finnis TaxID=1754191 RepID=A0A1Y1VP01_9FUNG|nr:hypothetical protein BCR36DRAFT_578954 [Piromyces finnis]|eukprot:ORX60882.1 hypothetical protein BCR36DRAFT_578954 [Piromyces finnis]
MENLIEYYNTVIDKVATKATEVFNNSYNLNLNKNSIINSLEIEDNVQAPTKEMSELNINDTYLSCMAIKRDKTNCSNKCVPGRVYCRTHLNNEGKVPLPEHIKMVASKYKYEVIANTISLGNDWINYNKTQERDQKQSKWPIEVKIGLNSLNSYILFFTEFPSYFGAGILIIQFLSKKESYFLATHYVEVNKYCEEVDNSEIYAKLYLRPLSSLKDKPIFKKIEHLLSEYGIPYDVNEINKKVKIVNENNPIVIYNNVDKVINSHYNLMYFHYNEYIKSKINKE